MIGKIRNPGMPASKNQAPGHIRVLPISPDVPEKGQEKILEKLQKIHRIVVYHLTQSYEEQKTLYARIGLSRLSGHRPEIQREGIFGKAAMNDT